MNQLIAFRKAVLETCLSIFRMFAIVVFVLSVSMYVYIVKSTENNSFIKGFEFVREHLCCYLLSQVVWLYAYVIIFVVGKVLRT